MEDDMTIIKVAPYENGAHDNNTIYGVTPDTFPIPEGWAIVPHDMPIPDAFPFVDIEVSVGDPPVVTSMTARTVPEPEPSIEEQIAALKAELSATDYQAIKYAEGWLTAEEYAPVKAQRQAWRDEINELEGQSAKTGG